MITDVSCGARLDLSGYHECCIFSPGHSGSHYDGLYYWETGNPSERQAAGERAAEVLGLVRRRRSHRAEVLPERSRRLGVGRKGLLWSGPAPNRPAVGLRAR